MTKYFCDKCGVEFDRPLQHTFEVVNQHGLADGTIASTGRIMRITLCRKCEESFLDWAGRPDLKTGLEPKSFKSIFPIQYI